MSDADHFADDGCDCGCGYSLEKRDEEITRLEAENKRLVQELANRPVSVVLEIQSDPGPVRNTRAALELLGRRSAKVTTVWSDGRKFVLESAALVHEYDGTGEGLIETPCGTLMDRETGVSVLLIRCDHYSTRRQSDGKIQQVLLEREYRTDAGQPAYQDPPMDREGLVWKVQTAMGVRTFVRQ